MTTQDHDEAYVASRVRVGQLVYGYMAAQVFGVAARLGLADTIGDRERSADDLADACGVPAGTLTRLLRALAALDVLTETSPGRFTLTDVGALLRTDRSDSVHAFTRMFTDPAMTAAWQHLESSLRTGRTAFDDVFGTDFFAHLAGEPELSALFNAAMSTGTSHVAATLPTHYDFRPFDTVADIGGGDGTLLAAILRQHPDLHGILFDTAAGTAQAADTLRDAAVAERCTVDVGDFFAGVPTGAQLYLLKSIVHDWDDDRAATILSHCRTVIPDRGTLLLIEPVLPETVDPAAGPGLYLTDLNMLVNVGGRERTRSDFEHLLTRSGFALTRVLSLPPPQVFRLIEAAPADP